MIDALLVLAILLAIAFGAGWTFIWPWVKAKAASKGVGIFTGSEMMLFPTAEANPTTAMHFKMYGFEARNWFVGTLKSQTLVRQQVTPAKVKILGPND